MSDADNNDSDTSDIDFEDNDEKDWIHVDRQNNDTNKNGTRAASALYNMTPSFSGVTNFVQNIHSLLPM